MKKLIYFCVMMGCMQQAALAASFDCNKARLATEKQICAVRALNDADVKLVTTYNFVLSAVPMGGRDSEKGNQYQWLKQRNQCGAKTQCIAQVYQKRQAYLDHLIETRVLNQGPF